MSNIHKINIYTDGGSRGNPGPAAIGIVITDEKGVVIKTHGECIGKTTNNQAEYRALVKAFELAKEFSPKEIHCFADSELMIKQLKQEYRVKDKDLQPLFVKIWNLALPYAKVSYTHIRREKNSAADALVNEALDKA